MDELLSRGDILAPVPHADELGGEAGTPNTRPLETCDLCDRRSRACTVWDGYWVKEPDQPRREGRLCPACSKRRRAKLARAERDERRRAERAARAQRRAVRS